MNSFCYGIICGLLVGGSVGFFIACLLQVIREDRYWRGQIKKEKTDAVA